MYNAPFKILVSAVQNCVVRAAVDCEVASTSGVRFGFSSMTLYFQDDELIYVMSASARD